METIKKGHGGKRSGCGRKPKNRNNKFTIRISDEAAEILRGQKNVTDFLEGLILTSVGEGQETEGEPKGEAAAASATSEASGGGDSRPRP